MYMPIQFPFPECDIRIPDNLKVFAPLVEAIGPHPGKFIYLTAKHLFVSPSYIGNRPGWHSDGFLSNDLNYIWSDKFPTEFCVQDFGLSPDHEVSMYQMEQQAREENIRVYPDKSLLLLDQFQIHRSPTPSHPCMRTFVKLSVSDDRYNLIGNAHNYLFDYAWKMYPRADQRNHPIKK